MPLTKVKYDMLDADVTDKIKTAVTLSGAGSPLVFDTVGSTNTLSKFKVGGVDNTIRSASFNNNGLLQIELATFTPTLAAAGLPGASLNWDEAATGFSVTVANPDDFPSSFIDAVVGIAAGNGTSVSETLSAYTAGAKSVTPAGGVDWTQEFTAGGSSYIRSNGTGSTGGTAKGIVSFTYNDGTVKPFTTDNADFTINWGTPVASITLGALTGKTFLETYTESTFTPSITNIADIDSNCEYTVSATNATNPGVKAAGTHSITFTTPIHKTNASSTTTKVSLSAKISRPAAVTGTAYDTPLTAESSSVNSSASFTYPSFYTWTSGTATKPTRSDCVDESALDASAVTVLGDKAKAFAGIINNTESQARAFWFAIKASGASQPTVFQTGTSASLLSDYSGVVTSTVALAPDVVPVGYTAETYNLYGIILQPGQTYVRIA